MIIREWTFSDIPDVHKLIKQLATYVGYDFKGDISLLEKQFNEMAKFKDIYANYVYEDQNKIIGFISVIFYHSALHYKGAALINELIVSEEYRGKGVGKELLNYAVEKTKKDGWDEIELGVKPINKKAREFYKKNGFHNENIFLGKILIE